MTRTDLQANKNSLKVALRVFLYLALGLPLLAFLLSFMFDLLGFILPEPRDQHQMKQVAMIQIGNFETAVNMFKSANGDYPAGTNGLNSLVVQPAGATNWRKLMDKIPLDPWGHAYLYQFPGEHRTNSYDLSSAGPDGKFGTADDIANWQLPRR